MNIRPLRDHILVKVHENSELSSGGIYTGQATTTFVTNKSRTIQKTVGEVLAIGPGCYDENNHRRPPECNIGDIVCFSDTCGKEVDEHHLMIREQDIAFFMDDPQTVELVYKD